MPAIDAAISTATGGTCLATAGALYVADHLPGIKKFAAKIKSPQIQVVLILTATIGLVATPLGQLLNRTVTAADQAIGRLVGEWTGVGISFGLALAALLWLISDFVTGVKPRTLILAALVPFLAVMIPGVIGSAAASVLGFIATQVGSLVVALMGG